MPACFRALRLRSAWVIVVAVCLCAAALRNPALSSVYRGNLWSREVAYALVHPGGQRSELPPILTDHPRSADWQALFNLKQGRADLAITSLTAANGGQRADYLSSGILAIGLQQDGQVERAVSIWRSLGAYQRLVQAGHSALNAHHTHTSVLAFRAAWELDSVAATAQLAEALLADGGLAESEQLLRQALSTYPSQSRNTFLADGSGCAPYATRALFGGDCHVLSAAAQQSTSCGECRIRLGQALYCAGKGTDAAKAEIEAGIALDPHAYLGYFALGQMYEREKRYAEAETWLGQALTFSPERSRGLDNAGRERAFQLGSCIGHSYPETGTVTLSRFHLPCIWYWPAPTGNQVTRSGAVAAIEKATTLEPVADTWLLAGQIYEWGQKEQRASAAYNEALRLDSSNQPARDGLSASGQHQGANTLTWQTTNLTLTS